MSPPASSSSPLGLPPSDADAPLADDVRHALPAYESISHRCEPDAYGASHLIARKLGMRHAPRSFAHWKHGWPHADLHHPVQLVGHASPDDTCLVPRAEHVELLREFGYLDAHAAGLPFVYAQSQPVERRPGSLLVMPPHTLPYTDESWDEEAYVEAIASLKSSFSSIVACVHRDNIRKGQWTEAFERRGIEWIPGTRAQDKHGLTRMHTLFSMFEYMTTNTVGSHVPYAAYCGCKVSIYGPFSSRRKEDYQNDPLWSKHMDVLEQHLASTTEEATREKFPFLFVSPDDAERHDEWAARELGERFRRPPQEIAWLLGWATADQVRGYLDRWTTPQPYLKAGSRVRDAVEQVWARLVTRSNGSS